MTDKQRQRRENKIAKIRKILSAGKRKFGAFNDGRRPAVPFGRLRAGESYRLR